MLHPSNHRVVQMALVVVCRGSSCKYLLSRKRFAIQSVLGAMVNRDVGESLDNKRRLQGEQPLNEKSAAVSSTTYHAFPMNFRSSRLLIDVVWSECRGCGSPPPSSSRCCAESMPQAARKCSSCSELRVLRVTADWSSTLYRTLSTTIIASGVIARDSREAHRVVPRRQTRGGRSAAS